MFCNKQRKLRKLEKCTIYGKQLNYVREKCKIYNKHPNYVSAHFMAAMYKYGVSRSTNYFNSEHGQPCKYILQRRFSFSVSLLLLHL